MANGTNRDVNLNIRATDSTGPGVKSATTALQRFAAAQKATQARRDLYSNAIKSARDLMEQAAAAGAATEALGRKLSDAKRPSAQLKANFAETRAEAKRLKDEFTAVITTAGRLNGRIAPQTGSFAAFERTAEALRDQRIATDGADDAINRLARDLPKAEAAQRRFAGATAAAAGSTRKQAAGGGVSGDIVEAYASKSGRGPLGLRPYELQNLGYQVNDLVTQIAGGTPVMQAFAQQGGQIAQIFPAATGAILRAIPVVGLIAVALTPLVVALKQANDEANTLKGFDQLLVSVGNGSDYSATKLANLAARLDDYGGSLADARAALSAFVRDDVAPAYLERFGKSALDLSKVLKIDVADAADRVSKAFAGNASDILSLDDSINFLSKSERDHIEVLQKSGKEAKARTEAFAIFERRYDAAAAKMRGPWTASIKSLDNAFQNFVESVNTSDFSRVFKELQDLARLAERLAAALPGARGKTQDALEARAAALDRKISNSDRDLGILARQPVTRLLQNVVMGSEEGRNTRLRQERFQVGYDLAALQNQRNEVPTPAVSDTTLDPPKPAGAGRSTRSPAETAAERLAKAQEEFNEDLDAANLKRTKELELVSESARQQEVIAAVESARARAADAGLTFTEDQAKAIRDSVGALYDANIEQEAFNKVSEANLDLATRRGEVETREAYIARQLVAEKLTQEMALYAIRADQIGQLYDLEQKARDREASEKSVNDLLTQQGELQAQLTFAQEQGDQSAAAILAAELDAVNAKLLLAVNNSILFWKAVGGPEAQAALLVLLGLKDRLEGTGKAAVVTGKQINESIADKGANALQNFAERIADGENAIKAFGASFLQMAADFLREIAMMIARTAVLNAIGGGKGTGDGGIGGFAAGLVNTLFRHNGGLVGQGGGFKQVNIASVLGAVQYHTGGIAGQKPDEVSAMLKIGEEVLTEDDPRHRNNLGKSGGGGSVKTVVVLDPADMLSRALASDEGERTFFHWVRNNGAAFKAAIG